jgi:hypothetical protein
MKMVIEKLEAAKGKIALAYAEGDSFSRGVIRDIIAEADCFIDEAIAELKTPRCSRDCVHFGSEDSCCIIGSICDGEYKPKPRWYTPERWEEKTGEALTDSTPVFFRRKVFVSRDNSYKRSDNWDVDFWKDHKGTNGKQIVIAIPAGPPPDGWEPEDTE